MAYIFQIRSGRTSKNPVNIVPSVAGGGLYSVSQQLHGAGHGVEEQAEGQEGVCDADGK